MNIPERSGRGFLRVVMLAAAIVTVVPYPAEAYLDSGNTNIVINLVVSAFFGMMFYFRAALTTVLSWFRPARSRTSSEHPE